MPLDGPDQTRESREVNRNEDDSVSCDGSDETCKSRETRRF